MSIPYDQTVAELCRTALRRAGQPTPSSGQIQEAVSQQFQEVKNDIRRKSDTHPLLETKEVTLTTIGRQEYDQPTQANVVKSILLYDGPDEWRVVPSSGSTSQLIMEAEFSASSEDLVGKQLFSITGANARQYSYVTAYDNSTKIVDFAPTVASTINNLNTVLFATYRNEIYNNGRQILNYDDYRWALKGLPYRAALSGETLYLEKGPDKIYPLLWTYYVDIEKLDETSDLFLKILREWRSLFIAGVTAKSMLLYDDTRALEVTGYYEGLLDKLGEKSLEVGQTEPYDPTYS